MSRTLPSPRPLPTVPAPRAAGATVPGRGRASDDRVLVDPARGLYAVADGIGGVRHGARSAQLVVDELPRLLDAARGDLPAAVAAVDRELRRASRHWVGGIGTTIVSARVEDGVATVVHAGDSRAYLWRAGCLDALTVDHTMVQILADAGRLDPPAARRHPGRSQLVRHLGVPGESVQDVVRVPLRPGDRLLLCSDGLVGARPEPELAAVLRAGRPAGPTCRALVDGDRFPDDATVVVVDVPDGDSV